MFLLFPVPIDDLQDKNFVLNLNQIAFVNIHIINNSSKNCLLTHNSFNIMPHPIYKLIKASINIDINSSGS